MPLLVLIRPARSGKTTAIRNRAWSFRSYDHEIQGVGGTRNCDGGFQLSDPLDPGGWYRQKMTTANEGDAFLEILKKNRRRQPMNGVLFASAS